MKKTKSTPRATPRRCAVSTGSASMAYGMHIHVQRGGIWEDGETIDTGEHASLTDAFAAGAARCIGIAKRTGWPTRLTFVCKPNKQDDTRHE